MIGVTDSYLIGGTTAADSFLAPLEHVSAGDVKIAATRSSARTSKAARGPSTSHAIEIAVYEHIRAMRTLGHKSLNTNDVARALSLPREIVEQAVAGLSTHGVRVAK